MRGTHRAKPRTSRSDRVRNDGPIRPTAHRLLIPFNSDHEIAGCFLQEHRIHFKYLMLYYNITKKL